MGIAFFADMMHPLAGSTDDSDYIGVDAGRNGIEAKPGEVPMKRRDALRSLFAAAVAQLVPRLARAQGALSARPIRLIVPVSPGGGVDTLARLIAAKIAERHRVDFVVENRTGGNGTIAGLDVNRAVPDGHTLLFHASTHIVESLVMREVAYDPLTGFTPIALAGRAPLIHIIANKRPQRTVAEIVAAAKKKPDEWSFATAQLGAPGHLAEVAFNQYNGLNIPVVVYRGTAPAANDVVGGHVPMMIEAIPALLPLVKAGSVRAVAVTGKKRTPLAPGIPTMTELGLPQLDFGAWWGLWGPPGMPGDVIATLNGWTNEAVAALSAQGRLAALGIEPAATTPAAFAQFIRSDFDRSARLLKAAKFHAQ